MEETTALPHKIEPLDEVYRDRNQTIQRVIARFDGFSKEYFVSDHGRRAAMLARRNDEVLLVRQYRLLINALSYEIPGGRVETDESPEDAAARECLEETGVACAGLRPLICFHPSLDIWKNYTHIFYTEDCRETSSPGSERRAWIPFARCLEMVFDGRISDALSILALLAFHAGHHSGK